MWKRSGPLMIAMLLALGPTGASICASSEPSNQATRVDLPAGLVAGVTLTDIAVGDAGWVVVGLEDASGSPRPRVLHSADGVTWVSGQLPNRPEWGLLAQVVAHDDGFVATGLPGALWDSADGVSWQAHELKPPLDSAYFHDLTVHEGNLYAVGCIYLEEQSCSDIGVWRTDDLTSMQPLPLPDAMAFVPYGVAATIVAWSSSAPAGGAGKAATSKRARSRGPAMSRPGRLRRSEPARAWSLSRPEPMASSRSVHAMAGSSLFAPPMA